MNDFDIMCKQQPKTVDEIKLPTWNKLIEILDLSPDNDWESIARYFPKYFTQYDISRIKIESKKSNTSPSQAVLEVLRNNLVPITRLYRCFVDYQLVQACNYLEKDFPNEAVYKRNIQTLASSQGFPNFNNMNSNNLNNSNNNSLNSLNANSNGTTRDEIKQFDNQEAQFKNLCLADISNQQNQPPNLESPQQAALLISVKNLIDLYEEILPVIQENKPPVNDPIMMSSSSYLNFESSLPVSLRMFGKFEICFINERKLTFKKREFANPFDYIRELKMIKHRHLNLYTAECVYKNMHSSNYFLLYNYESNYPTKLLTEYASENLNTLLPSQYNTFFQLAILRDIACGLTYLHDRQDKKNAILHGNLQPDCILLEFRTKDQIVAKIFDFTNAIELTDSENYESKLKDEFYRFGQLIFMVTNWRYMDRFECDNIHNQRYEDLNQYQYTLYRQFNMDKHANSHISQTLLRMFFALTSANYDTQKGIKKSYDFLKDLLEKLTAEKNKSLWT